MTNQKTKIVCVLYLKKTKYILKTKKKKQIKFYITVA